MQLQEIVTVAVFLLLADSEAASPRVTQVITKDDNKDSFYNALWCPLREVGTQCPPNDLIYYYKCCGNLNKDCCSHLRVWVMVAAVLLPTILLIPLFSFVLRRFFCRRGSNADDDRYVAGIRSPAHR